MVKEYFLRFGYHQNNKGEIAKIISDKLEVDFTLTSGDNYYHNFKGFSDRISIFDNYLEEDDWWQFESFKNCPIIVSCSFTGGKNIDKEARAIFMRDKLCSILELEEIEFKVMESKN
jgi:hypothetical protein